MRLAIVCAAGLLALSSATIRCFNADAQQLSAEASPEPDLPAPPHHMRGWAEPHALAGGPATLGLLYTAPDRHLSQDDVRKIAEAFLLWHGNHDWRVIQLTTQTDQVIFSIANAQNAVIASFAMNRHTGALTRIG